MKEVFVLCAIVFSCLQTAAQREYDAGTKKLIDEFTKIQSSLDANESKSDQIKTRSITYYTQESGDQISYDTLVMTYSTSGENFIVSIGPSDSIKVIQNDSFQVAVYKYDRMVTVQKPVAVAHNILPIDMLDSMFQTIAMQSISATDSGAYRKLTVSFKADAPYSAYQVMYHKNSYELAWIKFSARREEENSGTKRMDVRMVFSKPSYSASDHFFSIDDYVKVLNNGDFRTAELTQNYEIVSLINE